MLAPGRHSHGALITSEELSAHRDGVKGSSTGAPVGSPTPSAAHMPRTGRQQWPGKRRGLWLQGGGVGWGGDTEGARRMKTLVTEGEKDRCVMLGWESRASCEPSKVDFHILPPCLSPS